MKKLTGLAVVALLAAGAAGCGGDDKPLSKREYIKRGNAICAKGNKKIDAAVQKAGNSPTPKQMKKLASDDLVPSVEDQLDKLRELNPPKGDEKKVEKIYKAADAAVDKVKADPGVIVTSDPFTKANKAARRYGLTVCGA